MPYRVIVVDDEPLARSGIEVRLRQHRDFVVARACGSGHEALAAIRELSPDVVFLDIQMPGMSGLEVVRALPPPVRPAVIFTTAHEQYALSAFDVQAIDYLLKPIDHDRLSIALERARRFIGAARDGGAPRRPPPAFEPAAQRFWVRTGAKVLLIPIADVDWIAAEGDYARLRVGTRSYLVGESIASMQDRLAPQGFARIHRSTIVNLDRIASVRWHRGQDRVITLTDGVELRVSRTYARDLVTRLRHCGRPVADG